MKTLHLDKSRAVFLIKEKCGPVQMVCLLSKDGSVVKTTLSPIKPNK